MKLKKLMTALIATGLMTGAANAACFQDDAQTGWTGSVTFHCDQDTDLLNNPIHFDVSNGVTVSSVWGINGKTTVSQTGEDVQVTAEDWWPENTPIIAKAGESMTLSFSPSSNNFQISNFHVGGTVEKSHGKVQVQLPAKPDFIQDGQLADVILYQGNTKIAEINDLAWGKTANIDVEFAGDSADYSVSVPTLEDANGLATPATFTLKNGGTQAVKISYEAPAPKLQGNLSLVATVVGNEPTARPTYTVKNAAGDVVEQGKLNFDQAVLVKDLATTQDGEVYTVESANFSEAGFNYTSNGLQQATVVNGKTTPVKFVYTAEAVPTEQVTINVSDLPAGQKSVVTLSNGDSNEVKTIEVKQNGSEQVEVPQDGKTWSVSASSINGYKAVVTPSSFVADAEAQAITVKYQESVKPDGWPAKSVVGYVRGYDAEWVSQPDTTDSMIEQSLNHGYNVIVYAFAGQKSDGQPFFTKFTPKMLNDLPQQINIIHNHKGIALLSIGGAENYFDPDMSGEHAVETGRQMGEFLAQYNFDGLDVDVEHPNASATEQNFLNYIEAMRTAYKEKTGKALYLTAAPQVNGWYGQGDWASGEAHFAEQMYTQNFMDNAHFDAVFIQTYNQYGGANFAGLKGVDVGFLTMTFKLLSPETRTAMKGVPDDAFYVPEDTKIVLGVPDYKAPNVTQAEYNTGACLADASCSGVGLYNPTDINQDILEYDGNLNDYNQYGGVMTWILNSDAYQGWTWVDGIQPSVQD